MEYDNTNRKITVGCGVWGPVLSAVIVAARAVCGNVPMEEWSCMSWFWMTLPVTAPFVVFVAVAVSCAALYLSLKAVEWISGLFRRDD